MKQNIYQNISEQTRKLIFYTINYLQSLKRINNRKSSHTFEEARIRNHQTIPDETKHLSKHIQKNRTNDRNHQFPILIPASKG